MTCWYTATPGSRPIFNIYGIALGKKKKKKALIYDSTLQVNKYTLGSNLKSIGNQYGDTVVLYDYYEQHE